MQPGAVWTMPPAAHESTLRTLYFFGGSSLGIDGERLERHQAALLESDRELRIEAGAAECEILVLQGRPIAEPVAQYGPFVMNDRAGIETAISDYRRTGFGGWPWGVDDPVHARERGRFARHADGRVEEVEAEPERRLAAR
jgi:redox-sensitive bicupin YhaK (pirin superfamily)